jgi:hypothetical protein
MSNECVSWGHKNVNLLWGMVSLVQIPKRCLRMQDSMIPIPAIIQRLRSIKAQNLANKSTNPRPNLC